MAFFHRYRDQVTSMATVNQAPCTNFLWVHHLHDMQVQYLDRKVPFSPSCKLHLLLLCLICFSQELVTLIVKFYSSLSKCSCFVCWERNYHHYQKKKKKKLKRYFLLPTGVNNICILESLWGVKHWASPHMLLLYLYLLYFVLWPWSHILTLRYSTQRNTTFCDFYCSIWSWVSYFSRTCPGIFTRKHLKGRVEVSSVGWSRIFLNWLFKTTTSFGGRESCLPLSPSTVLAILRQFVDMALKRTTYTVPVYLVISACIQ